MWTRNLPKRGKHLYDDRDIWGKTLKIASNMEGVMGEWLGIFEGLPLFKALHTTTWSAGLAQLCRWCQWVIADTLEQLDSTDRPFWQDDVMKWRTCTMVAGEDRQKSGCYRWIRYMNLLYAALSSFLVAGARAPATSLFSVWRSSALWEAAIVTDGIGCGIAEDPA